MPMGWGQDRVSPPTEKEKEEAKEYADFYEADKNSERWKKLYEAKLKTLRSM